jgi:hypothetical protein
MHSLARLLAMGLFAQFVASGEKQTLTIRDAQPE